MNFFKYCTFFIIEKILRWSPHPKIRSSLLAIFGANVSKDVRVEEVCFVGLECGFVNLILSDSVYIGPRCIFDLTETISIGSRTVISPNCLFLTHADPGSKWNNILAINYPRKVKKILIGSDCWIGAGTTILCGVSIGNGSVVGAGSLIIRDIPENAVVVGSPGRIVKLLK